LALINFNLQKEKIDKVLALWHKYGVWEQEVLDKLTRLSATAKIDSALQLSAAAASTTGGSKEKKSSSSSSMKSHRI
jgi:hypothetical protein